MAAGRYSAGRIFLQVVPSFKGFQREIDREVKKANRGMAEGLEKEAGESGRKAGRKAGGEFLMGFTEWTSADQKKLQSTFARQLINLDKMQRKARDKAAADAAADAERADREAAKALKRAEAWAQKGAESVRKQRVKLAAEERAESERQYRENVKAYQRAQALADRAAKAEKKIRDRARADEEAALRKSMARRGGLARTEIEKALRGIDDSIGELGFGRKIDTELERIRRKAKDVGKDLSDGLVDTTRARAQVEALGRSLKKIQRSNPGLGIEDRGNIRAAIGDIERMGAALDSTGKRGSGFRNFLRGATNDGQDGANAFRIFNYRVLGLATALPLLAPLLATAGAGIVALGTAALGAAAGLGVMVLAFSGIGAAVKALGDVQDNAAKDALAQTKTMRNASRSVRDARQGLAQARLQAARGAEDSARRIADAEENVSDARQSAARNAEDSSRRIAAAEKNLADAQRDATQAQKDLREARAAAQADQDALADRLKSGALDERQALIDLFNAQVQYNAAMADGGATNLEKEQASIDLERARLAIKGIRRENKEMAAEQAKYAKQGADGTERVQGALEAQRTAAQGVADAEQGVADARRDAAQQAADDAKRVRDAERGVADARRDAAQQAADSQRAVRDAQERLSDSQAAYQEALTSTGEIGSASMSKLEQAMAKLSPAGRTFALFIHSLRDDFQRLRAVAQEGLLPGVQESMEGMFKRYGPGFEKFVGKMATELGGFFVHASKVLQSPVWENFFAMMDRNGPLFAGAFGEIFLDISTGFAGIMTAFEPFTVDFVNGMLRVSQSFADWGAALGENEGFQKFLDYLEVTGPKVWEFFKQFGRAFVAVGIAIAPVADFLLDLFTKVFKYIADMDPDLLAAIVTGILGFVLASQAAAGSMQLLKTLTTPFHSLLGAVVFLFIALGAALIYAYQHNEDFRESVQKVFKWIKDNKDMLLQVAGFIGLVAGGFLLVTKVIMPLWAGLKIVWTVVRSLGTVWNILRLAFVAIGGPIAAVIAAVVAIGLGLIWLFNHNKGFHDWVIAAWDNIRNAAIWLWENGIKPAFSAFVDILQVLGTILLWVWDNVLWPTFQAIGAIIGWLWNTIFKPYFGFIFGVVRFLAEIFMWVWGIIGPIFELFGAIVGALWRNILSPIFGWIGDRFGDVGDAIGTVYNRYIAPILEAFGINAETLRGLWETAISGIGTLWDGLVDLLKAPLRFIVETIINRGFVDNFNKLAEYFGTSKIDHLSLSWLNAAPPKGKASYGGGGSHGVGGYASGGYTGPGSKYQPAGIVHADEYVIRKESTNRLRRKYGLSALNYINEHGELPGMGGYATGGLVAFGKLLQSKGFRVSENPAFGGVNGSHSRTGWHYRGGAIDVNWPNGQRQSAEETAKINAIVGLARQYGLRTLWQWKGHYDHAHFDIDKGPDLGNFAGAGGGRSAELPWWIERPYEFIKDKVEGLFSKIPGAKSGLGKMLTGMPIKLLDFAKEKIAELINGGGDYSDTGDGGAFGGGIEQWRDEVVRALQMVGQPVGLADTVLRRMMQESSGNPRAINRTDSNWLRGTPSKGLMQVIDPTFAQYRDKRLPNDVYNPMSNIVASMRYAINRYGSLSSAYNRQGGYAEGGLVTEGAGGLQDNGTMMYDNGGYLPPGITQVVNLTGRPEPVFTGAQWDGMQAGGGARSALIGNLDIDVNGSDVTANDVVSELMYQLTRVEHGGKYAGRAD